LLVGVLAVWTTVEAVAVVVLLIEISPLAQGITRFLLVMGVMQDLVVQTMVEVTQERIHLALVLRLSVVVWEQGGTWTIIAIRLLNH